MRFPLPYVPAESYRGANGFGANRDRVRRGLRHGAVDLFAPPGTPVLAIDDGVVTRRPYAFYSGTFALEVRHPQFVARYGEIAARTEVKVGSIVLAGQVIAYVGDQPGYDMLHLELYAGTASGDLTQRGQPFDRRADLLDPTPYLDRLVHTVMNVKQAKYQVWTDEEGRKFLIPSKQYLIDL